MIEAVIFDMDGLMIDSEVICYEVYRDLLRHDNIELTKQQYTLCFAGKTMTNGLLCAREYFHLNFDIDDAEKFSVQKEKEYVEEKGVALKPGLLELLRYLKNNNMKCAIATSSGLERIHQLVDKYDILKHYDVITCGHEVCNGKPAPDIFLKACEKLGVKPENALVLEDSEAGIQAGYSAHIPVICIPDMTYPSDKYQEMTTAVLGSLEDVIDYIEGK